MRCEDVILVMVCSYLEKVAGGTGMGLMISDHDRRAFYPLFISFSRVTDVHYNRHWALEFQHAIVDGGWRRWLKDKGMWEAE